MQTVEDVCAGLDAAWAFFGGIVRRVVLDNATSMVVRADAPTSSFGSSVRVAWTTRATPS
jgi:hypothetical protein